jgi:hypothetical protein
MTTTRKFRSIVLLSMLAVTGLGAGGCAAPTEEDDASSSSAAQTRNPVYDAVIANGTKVETDATRSASVSAETHLIGYVKRGNTDALLAQLLSVGRWTEIADPEGDKPFKRAEVLSDTGELGARTVTGKITMDKGVTLEVRAVATAEGGTRTVRIVNTTGFKHWLAGTILEANRLFIDVKLVPYEGGVIVDATMRAKLKKMEDKAPELTASLESIFTWLE